MSIEDSVDQLFTTAELFAPDPDRLPHLNDRVIYRDDTQEYAAVISAIEAFDDERRRVQRLTVFHPYGPPFNVSAGKGAGVGEWWYQDAG
jgi:hypothetical protein